MRVGEFRLTAGSETLSGITALPTAFRTGTGGLHLVKKCASIKHRGYDGDIHGVMRVKAKTGLMSREMELCQDSGFDFWLGQRAVEIHGELFGSLSIQHPATGNFNVGILSRKCG